MKRVAFLALLVQCTLPAEEQMSTIVRQEPAPLPPQEVQGPVCGGDMLDGAELLYAGRKKMAYTLTRQQRRWPEAQLIDDPKEFRATVLALARICVSEASWESDRDCQAIYQVFRNTRRSTETLLGVMHRHTNRVLSQKEPLNSRQAWLQGLRLDASPPPTFPRPWEGRFERAWRSRVRLAERILTEPNRFPCRGPVITWGGAMDDHIAIRRGLTRVNCGVTMNHFWRR